MKPAKPVWEGMETHNFGVAALLLALLVPASLWLVASASLPRPERADARRIEFVRSAAGIQGRVRFMRELEKHLQASSASAQKSAYYRQRREEARRRVDELARSAAALADRAEERARLEALAVLVRVADARYEHMQKTDFTMVQR